MRRSAAIVLALAAGSVIGCDEKPDTLAQTIREARNTLVSISGAGGVSAATEYREQAYGRVISKLQAASRDAERPGSVAAVNLLLAQAQGGQADIEAAKARQAIGEFQMGLNDARAKLELYLSHRSLAASMSAVDTAAPIREFEAQIATVSQSLRAVQEQQRQSQDDLAAVKAEADELRARATELRANANALSAAALSLDGTQRTAKVTEAAKAAREADGYEKRLSLHALKVDEVQRMVDEVARQLTAVERQRTLLEEARQRAADGQRIIAGSVSSAREDAGRAADELDQALNHLREILRDRLTPAYEAATSKYTEASGSASRARQADRQAQTHAVGGGYDHAAATLHLSYAELLEQAVALLGRMTSVTPALPGRDTYQRLSGELASASKAASQSAAESFGKAAAGYQAAQAPGAAREVFTQLGEELGRIERRLKGEPETAPASDEMPAEPTDDSGLGFGAADDAPMDDGAYDDEPVAEPVPEE